MNTFLSYIHSCYSYNSKFLSIGRILIASIILTDLFFRYQNIEAHYSDAGVLPISVIKHYYPFYQYYFSFHNFCNSISSIKILFLIHFIAALFLLAGFKTKFFTIINFILLISLHHRNPLILQGGDDLLRLTLFYMIFLPCGKFFSLDNIVTNQKNNTQNAQVCGFSWIFVVFQINIAFVYLFSAILKTADEWRITGDALYYALSLDTLRTGIGNFLYPHYPLLKILTFFVYYVLEIFAPVLLIISPNIYFRNLAALMIILLHLFIVFSLKVGIFPFVGITTAIMLLNISGQRTPIAQHHKKELFLSVFIFILIFRYNLATLNTSFFSITLFEDRFVNSIGLSQRWNMFSPGVKRYDGWLVLRGIKKDNAEWDLIHNTSKLQYERTYQNFNYLKGDRWRKFLENYEQTQYNFIKPYFCYYLIQQWNEKHPDNLIEALNILYVKKITLPNYQHTTELENLCLCNPKIDNNLR